MFLDFFSQIFFYVFDEKYCKNMLLQQNVLELFSILLCIKNNLFLWWEMNFQQPFLQSSVSNDPSEIILICWFGAQETFVSIINNETVFLHNI